MSRRSLPLCGPVALAAFVLYAATVCPTVPFGDGGELIAAAACLGVAHPPGYPLYTMLGWLALHVPIGEPALRMNLMSSVFAALTCGAVCALLLRRTGSAVGAAAGALVLAVTSTFWWVAVITEVYTLHLFLCALLLCAAAALGEASSARAARWPLLLCAVAAGLGLGHHPTIVLVLPAAMLLALRAVRDDAVERAPGWRRVLQLLPPLRPPWLVVAFVIALGLPALLYLSLMMRARLDPLSNWGEPTSLQTLIPHVTAATYRHLDLGWRGLARAASWAQLARIVANEFTVVVLPLAVLGLAGVPRRAVADGGLRLASAALLLVGGAFGLRYMTFDVEVFLLPLFLGLALAAGIGVARLAGHPRRFVRLAGIAGAVLLVLAPALRHAPSRQLRGMTAAADYGRDILRTIPPGGAVFVNSDDTFALVYLKQVLGERPDVDVYTRSGVLLRDVVKELRLPQRAGEPPRRYRLRVEQAFIEKALAGATPRDVFFAGWPGYSVPTKWRLEPTGLLQRLGRSDLPVRDDGPLWDVYHDRSVLAQAQRTKHSFAMAVAALYPIARGERALFAGDRAGAYAAFDEAAHLAKDNHGVQGYLGTVYGRIGDYARAIGAFQRAIEIQPGAIDSWNNLGMAYELQGQRARAIEAWRRSLELAPWQQDVRASLRRLEGQSAPR